MNPICEKTQEKILETLGTEWKPEIHQDLAAHLQTCPSCRELWDDCQNIRTGMDALEAEGPSELSVARILKAAESRQVQAREGRRSAWKFLTSRPFQVAAMFALILGVGIYAQKWLEDRGHGLRPSSETTPVSAPAKPESVAPTKGESGDEKAKAVLPPPPERRRETPPKAALPSQPIALPAPAPTTSRPAEPAPAIQERSIPAGRDALGTGGGAAPAADQAAEREKLDKAFRQMETAPKALQVPEGAPALEEKKTAGEEGEARSAKETASPEQKDLVLRAKTKINAGDYPGALQDLLKAQQLENTSEIEGLIELCRNHLKPEP